ncbi:nuclear RNA export factor 1-like [Maniola hyperantus]|uniref:nuclear RNA export factor 1-like n=1 Tax=Aphantopus hyperantus TaxID=2795564 RepID=UPI00156A4DBB|nr:nuclear RNA export factor 1-like [Maniola hyperantus]
MNHFDKYRKFLLNRMTSSQEVVDNIEKCLVSEDDNAKHSFHKILVCRWPDGDVKLFETLYEYFGLTFIPVNFAETNLLTSFYTNSLMLVLKIMKMDFMFPHCRNMFNLDILLNDKTSMECFEEKSTIDQIVTHVVSHRFTEHRELNLSNFCNDIVLRDKKIHFYKLSLLSHFKILMIRMGRDTKVLNLSSNNLSNVPLDILNFFIKGDLIGVNLSNNNIPSVAELQRISSKIEKLWVEGNPLCEDDLDAVTYIRQIAQKFPRLTELDGVPLNEHGIMMPFFKNFMVTSERKTVQVLEKFISLYFAHYDSQRRKIEMFYDPGATLTLATDFTESAEDLLNEPYAMHSRNFLNPVKRKMVIEKSKKLYKTRQAVTGVHCVLPETVHDLSTFNIDVLKHDNKSMVLVIDGVYKEKHKYSKERLIHFRRTFVIYITPTEYNNTLSSYMIVHEMFSISLATPEVIRNSFKIPARNCCQLTLINPDQEDRKAICSAFCHYTQLTKYEAEIRLKQHDWDIRKALKQFMTDLKNDAISLDKFGRNKTDEDDFSDLSSILDEDEID